MRRRIVDDDDESETFPTPSSQFPTQWIGWTAAAARDREGKTTHIHSFHFNFHFSIPVPGWNVVSNQIEIPVPSSLGRPSSSCSSEKSIMNPSPVMNYFFVSGLDPTSLDAVDASPSRSSPKKDKKRPFGGLLNCPSGFLPSGLSSTPMLPREIIIGFLSDGYRTINLRFLGRNTVTIMERKRRDDKVRGVPLPSSLAPPIRPPGRWETARQPDLICWPPPRDHFPQPAWPTPPPPPFVQPRTTLSKRNDERSRVVRPRRIPGKKNVGGRCIFFPPCDHRLGEAKTTAVGLACNDRHAQPHVSLITTSGIKKGSNGASAFPAP
ncbi:hypothetical protein QBC44DRAFT_308676 [Cladorrhinum sp. PSN332]|nr:hypothetical protein QBC44DRAFT_308676 [Cladorrhinum sp. PSN332]